MDWDSLRLVLAVERYGGLSGAGRALGLNHATVSRQLNRAEDALGKKLFQRLPTGLVATTAGASVVVHAERVEAEVIALDLELAAAGDDAGELSVTMPPLLLTQHLAQDFCDFKRSYPNIELKLLGDNRIVDLHRREADVAFRVAEAPAESLWGRKVAKQKSGYFGSAALVQQIQQRPGAPVPVIAFTAWAGIIPSDLTDFFPHVDCVATCDDMIAAIELVRAGLGVTRMPCFLGHRAPELELLPAPGLRPYPPIWILTHPDLRSTTRIAQFMSFMGKRFTERAPVYLGAQ